MLRNIYLVDPDDEARASLHRALAGESSLLVATFRTVGDFFERLDELRPGLALLASGTAYSSDAEVIGALHDRSFGRFESIILSENGCIPSAVAAMKAGALDFVEKPVKATDLLNAIDLAFEQMNAAAYERQHVEQARDKLARLSNRERDVLDSLVNGLSNKATAHELGISSRTVEVYRATMMRKLAARSLPDAVKTVFQARLARPM